MCKVFVGVHKESFLADIHGQRVEHDKNKEVGVCRQFHHGFDTRRYF